jgi:transporter family protein
MNHAVAMRELKHSSDPPVRGKFLVMKPILFAILAGLCWGVGEIFTKSVLHTGKVGPITAIAVRSSVALPILWLMYLLWVQRMQQEPSNWLINAGASNIWKIVLGSGLIAGAGGMIFFYLALGAGEISRVKPIAFTIAPCVAVILGWLVLGESMTLRKAVAVGMVLAGVVLLTWENESGRMSARF